MKDLPETGMKLEGIQIIMANRYFKNLLTFCSRSIGGEKWVKKRGEVL
jgi:hypothetical protein